MTRSTSDFQTTKCLCSRGIQHRRMTKLEEEKKKESRLCLRLYIVLWRSDAGNAKSYDFVDDNRRD